VKKKNKEKLSLENERVNQQRVKEKSEDDFEKNITYISAGALGLSITFLEKIVPIKDAVYFSLVIISWSFLSLTLLSNLLSHLYSSFIVDKTLDDLDENSSKTISNWERRVCKITIWNIINVIGLVVGIVVFIVFVSINLIILNNN